VQEYREGTLKKYSTREFNIIETTKAEEQLNEFNFFNVPFV